MCIMCERERDVHVGEMKALPNATHSLAPTSMSTHLRLASFNGDWLANFLS